MRVKDLRVGMDVRIGGTTRFANERRAIVLDDSLWTGVTKGWRETFEFTVTRGNTKGWSTSAIVGVPMAVLHGTHTWVPELVAPNMIVEAWAETVERRERVRIANAEVAAVRRVAETEKATLTTRAATVFEALGIKTVMVDGSVRLTDSLVAALESLVNAEVAK